MGVGRRPVAIGVLAVVATTAALWLAYGLGFVGYDAVYSLIWGRELMDARLPGYEIEGAPTPHPLATLVAALVSPLGDRALPALAVVSTLAFATLGVAAFQLGRTLFSVPVGVLFAALLLTRDVLVNGFYQALVEIPFLALVMCALVLEARRPRRGTPVVVLLALAGLLRPEAWLLAGAYVLYLWPGLEPGARRWAIAAALAAPVIWALSDLAVTGDPLHSLHHTQTGAERLERPRDVDVALRAAPDYLEQILHSPLVWVGLAGCATAMCLLYERALLPAAVLALGLAGFLVLGVAGVPLLPRYYYVPASMLALFCAVAVFGWRNLGRGSRPARAWMAGAAVVGVALVLSLPAERDRLSDVKSAKAERKRLESDLRSLLRAHTARAWLGACRPLYATDGRVEALASYWLGRTPGIGVRGSRAARLGTMVGPPPDDNRDYVLDPRIPIERQVPLAYRPVAESSGWALYRGC